ncbi:MAG: hypothetical protein JKY98_01210 [Gammaproteobacteria bacterium]|nr:hypothetical protein [Gammaproteobacteria bacterium]
MTISKELLFAILSMDSYNRGYGSGIGIGSDGLGSASNGSVSIGSATVSHNLGSGPIKSQNSHLL